MQVYNEAKLAPMLTDQDFKDGENDDDAIEDHGPQSDEQLMKEVNLSRLTRRTTKTNHISIVYKWKIKTNKKN